MTMDVHRYHKLHDASPERQKECDTNESEATQKSSKRCFDVAFLMLPDDKVKQKQLRVSKQLFNNQEWINTRTNFDDSDKVQQTNSRTTETFVDETSNLQDCNIDVGIDEFPSKTSYCSDSETSEKSHSRPASNESAIHYGKYLPEISYRNKIFDDPTLIMQARRYEQAKYMSEKYAETPRSAFTKVSNNRNFLPSSSPNPSVSPDNLSYQNSLSPPLSSSVSPTSPFKNLPFNGLLNSNGFMNNNPFLKSPPLPSYQNQIRSESFSKQDSDEKHSSRGKSQSPQINKMPQFRQELPPYLQPGQGYPYQMQNSFAAPAREMMNLQMANPAAAILSTLLPPTLAAFSLPAQNMCAKCNISFRMTSDLVYHMRTHHKNDMGHDPSRKRREEKLKCPVCSESFRERHHLTRHMTAHQDKESDVEDTQPFYSKGKSKNNNFTSLGAPMNKRI